MTPFSGQIFHFPRAPKSIFRWVLISIKSRCCCFDIMCPGQMAFMAKICQWRASRARLNMTQHDASNDFSLFRFRLFFCGIKKRPELFQRALIFIWHGFFMSRGVLLRAPLPGPANLAFLPKKWRLLSTWSSTCLELPTGSQPSTSDCNPTDKRLRIESDRLGNSGKFNQSSLAEKKPAFAYKKNHLAMKSCPLLDVNVSPVCDFVTSQKKSVVVD